MQNKKDFFLKARTQTCNPCCNVHIVSTKKERTCSSNLPSSHLYVGWFFFLDLYAKQLKS